MTTARRHHRAVRASTARERDVFEMLGDSLPGCGAAALAATVSSPQCRMSTGKPAPSSPVSAVTT